MFAPSFFPATRAALPLALAGAIAMTLFTGAAFAATPRAPTAQVSASGLDLASAQGRAELDRRIDRVAARLCSGDPRQLANAAAQAQCRAEAVASARPARQALVARAQARMASN